jgi:hypothetical protein
MAILNLKVVGAEGESVLIKYATENSAKPIDEYDAVAYQPRALGYSTLEEFIEGIKPALLNQAIYRDNLEKVPADLDVSAWIGHESTHAYEPPHNPSLVQANDALKEPEVAI